MKTNWYPDPRNTLLPAFCVLLLLFSLPAWAQDEVTLTKLTNNEDAKSPPGPVLIVGESVQWTYIVTATFRDLFSISVADDQGVIVTCPATTLEAGNSMVCTGSGIVAPGQYANVGTVDAELVNATPVTANDTSHYFGVDQVVIDLETATEGFDADSPPGPVLPVGSSVNWEYEVTNNGTETLNDVAVSDSEGVAVTCPANSLAPGESMICTASGTVTVGQYSNLGSVQANLPDNTPVAATDPSHYYGQALILTKSTNGEDASFPPGPIIPAGDPVNWTYEVLNPGPEAVSSLNVNDDQGEVVTCPATTLAAGDSLICTASGTAGPGQYANLGTVTAFLPLGGQVTASNMSHYFSDGIQILKLTNGEDASTPPGPMIVPGNPVEWTYIITNPGPETLSDIEVTDDQGVLVTCPATTLDPFDSMSCTGNGTALAGQYANMGTVTAELPSTDPVTASDMSHYLGGLITLEKQTNGQDAALPPGPTLPIGAIVNWDYIISNQFQETLFNIQVTDDQGEVVTCPGTEILAGESMTCTASGIVQPGQYANQGQVTAELDSGTQVTAEDMSHYLGRTVEIEKTTNGDDADLPPGPVLPVDSVVDWTYTVFNPLSENMLNVQVTDDQGETVTCPATEIPAGGTMICTASGTVLAGQYANVGQVTAEVADGTALNASDPSHYLGQAIELEKATNGEDADLPPGPLVAPGDPVTWTYLVTNPGPEEITSIDVTDDQGEVVSCPATTLAAGDNMTCTANGTAVAGQYANIGTVTALLPLGGEVAASDPSHYRAGQIALEKRTNGISASTPPGPVLAVGASVSWEYIINNEFQEPLLNVEVIDDQGETVTCPATEIPAGESMTCTASGTVQAGQYANSGLVTAELTDGTALNASDPSHYFGQAIELEKATNGEDADLPPGPLVAPGDPVTWTYLVTNPGPEEVTGIDVTDDQGEVVSCPATTLAAGNNMTCTANGTAVAGQYANIGTVTALLPLGGEVSASDPSHYYGGNLSLDILINGEAADSPPGPVFPAGSTVTWSYEITNGLPFELTNIEVFDSEGVTITCPASTLPPDETLICTASSVVSAGQNSNTVTVNATMPDDSIVSASNSSHHFGQHLLVQKMTNGEDAPSAPGPTLTPGETVEWTYQVTNPGPESITDLMVVDDLEGPVSCPSNSLAASESTTCTASGTAQSGQYVNIGTATAMLPLGGQLEASDSSHYFGEDEREPVIVPTLGRWGLLLMFLALMIIAWLRLPRLPSRHDPSSP
jgi:uncharacterized repeat protein (TIGR01451 family)